MARTIALLGPPGSGKGTQAARLSEALDFAHLATGDLLRQARADGTELGQRAAEYMNRGDLVPDDVIIAMLREALDDLGDRPVVLDGFPRTVAQAEALGRELDAAILIDVPDDVVADRISGRRDGRPDDDPETVSERLRVYHRDTVPLVAYYDQRGLLRRVDGAREADAVHAEISESISPRGGRGP